MNKNKVKIRLVIIDPQNDFMPFPNSTLPVAGADEDMKRLAGFVRQHGHRLESIDVTLDSHQRLHVAHGVMWRGQDGNQPKSGTVISSQDIKDGIWTPVHADAKPSKLGGLTIKEYLIGYTEGLANDNQKVLCIWPPHCEVGTPGHNVHAELMDALTEWSVKEYATVSYTTKGHNTWTEHYGGFKAERPMPSDPSTSMNTKLVEIIADADTILVAGEALSHCVLETVNQLVSEIGLDHISKICLMLDCMSPVGKLGDGPLDFPVIAEAWVAKMTGLGMRTTTSETFFN